MRIVSLLPSATELVCLVGARAQLVGRSHECDFPAGLEAIPILTRPRFGNPASSRGIDLAVRELLAAALGVYEIDLTALAAARPDVVVTQDLCNVCAIGEDDVRAALREVAGPAVTLLSLHPTRLAHVWDDVARVGAVLDRPAAAAQAAARLRARVDQVAERAQAAAAAAGRPRVLTIEWIDPVLAGGLWMPELVALAGGEPLAARAGEHAPVLDPAALDALAPEVVLITPCGFPLAQTLAEHAAIVANLPWTRWRERATVRPLTAWAADGNAYFNRSGPRLVESLEVVAACTHPGAFADLGARHAAALVALAPAA